MHRVKLKVNKKNDVLYFRLDESEIVESEKVQPSVILDFAIPKVTSLGLSCFS